MFKLFFYIHIHKIADLKLKQNVFTGNSMINKEYGKGLYIKKKNKTHLLTKTNKHAQWMKVAPPSNVVKLELKA